MSDEGRFELIGTIPLESIANGEVKEIKESDLAIQNETHLAQYKYIEENENKDKTKIKPGVFTLMRTNVGIKPQKLELKTHNLLETASNTQLIEREAKVFFNKLDVYKKFKTRPSKIVGTYRTERLYLLDFTDETVEVSNNPVSINNRWNFNDVTFSQAEFI